MIVYLYDPVTLEYLREGVAHPNQLVDGEFIHPANSTTLQPIDVVDGKVAKFIEGEWVESDPTSLAPEEIERLRALAYSDPVTGSDKHFLEASRKRATGDEDGAIEAELLGVARVEEIKEAIQ